MNAVALGPLVFSAERLTAILSLAVLVILAEILGRGGDKRLARWGWYAVLVFVIGARVGHVLDYLAMFRAEPWRIPAIWQGGFKVSSGIVATTVFTVIWFRNHGRLLARALIPAGAALAVAIIMLIRTGEVTPTALPDESFALLGGGTVVPADLKGQPVVANLWATWCPPCRREMPMMADVAASRDDVTFLFVNQREDETRVGNFLNMSQITLPNVMMDRFGTFTRHYAAIGLPVTLFIGSDGVLRAAHLGEISRETLLTRIDELP